jgi:hypothetical protein
MSEKNGRQVKITYTLTLNDVLVFARYQFKHSPKMRRVQLLYRTVIPVVIGVVLAMAMTKNFSEPPSLATGLIVGACFVLGFTFMPFTFRRSIEKTTKKLYTQGRNKSLLGTHKIVLDDQGFTDESGFGKASYPWKAIQSSARTEDLLFLYLSPEAAVIIPLKGLKKESKRDSLMAYADRCNEKP